MHEKERKKERKLGEKALWLLNLICRKLISGGIGLLRKIYIKARL